MKKTLIVILLLVPFIGTSQFSEKVSLQVEYGRQMNRQDHINTIILDTLIFSLGYQNDPRSEEFERVDAYGIRLNYRPSKLWDIGISGRWQQESVQHSGNSAYQDINLDINILQVATHRMEFMQFGANANFYANKLVSEGSNFEYGSQAELLFTQTEFENYSNRYETNEGAIFNNQTTHYNGMARGVASRLGLHASYGFVFGGSRLAIGINGGYQFGFSQNLSNSGGESFLDIYGQPAEVNLNGAYGSVFLKFSR